MDIYLVQVDERANGDLYLKYKDSAKTTDDYIAISHVWGSPETIQKTIVDGIEGTHITMPL